MNVICKTTILKHRSNKSKFKNIIWRAELVAQNRTEQRGGEGRGENKTDQNRAQQNRNKTEQKKEGVIFQQNRTV